MTTKTIEISQETYEFLKDLAHELKTQDNRCTDRPYWTVRVDKKIGAMDPEYAEDTEYVDMWDGDYQTWKTKEEAIDGIMDRGDRTREEAEAYFERHVQKFGFKMIEESRNFFLTEKGYEQHMKLNRHNYGWEAGTNSRSYVDCAFRNPEYDGLIKAIKEIGEQ